MKLRVSGLAINASTAGRALDPDQPLIVFVHGTGGDRTSWQLVTRHFSHHGYGVLAVDLPGHGCSEGPPPASIEEGASFLANLTSAAGYSNATFVGHSMGSFMSLELAATRPDLVDSLVLIGTAARMAPTPELLAAAKADDHLAIDLMNSWSHSRSAHLGSHATPGISLLGAGNRTLERAAPGVIYAGLAACAAYERAEAQAGRVEAPTLLLLGEADVMTRITGAQPLADAMDIVTMKVLGDTGHALMAENPDAVIDAIAEFLEAHTSSG